VLGRELDSQIHIVSKGGSGVAASFSGFALLATAIPPPSAASRKSNNSATNLPVYQPSPAVVSRRTRPSSSKGEAWYLGTELDSAFYHDLVRQVTKTARIHPPLEVPAGIEVTRRSGQGKEFISLLNHGNDTATVDLGSICGGDLLTGQAAHTEWLLPALGVAIFQISL